MKSHVLSFLSFLKTKKIPNKEDIFVVREAQFSISKIAIIVVIIFGISIFLNILIKLNSLISVEVPDYGGSITEGVIGAPKYINPILATSETDKVLSSLVYEGLMKNKDDGTLEPSLAENCVSNKEETSYQCVLKENIYFSDKSPITSSDVAFTFETKKMISIEKDIQSSWRGISIQTLDDRTVVISTSLSSETLKEKMTLGIVPKSLWFSIPKERFEESVLNMEPVGSGAFMVRKIKIVNTIPTEIILKRNPHAQTKPYVKNLIIKIFANQLDLKSSLASEEIQSTNALRGNMIDENLEKIFNISNISTYKKVSLVVNNNQKDANITKSLQSLNPFIDKIRIVDIIENGYGIPLIEDTTRSLSEVPKITGTEVPISIAVQKDEDLIATAELLSQSLKDFGIISTVNVFDQGIFTDQLSLGSYTFVLGVFTEDNIPGYQHLIPLYTKTLAHISSKEIHTEIPTKVVSSYESLKYAHLWHSRTDLVWKWFTHNI